MSHARGKWLAFTNSPRYPILTNSPPDVSIQGLEPKPVELASVVLFPRPLLRRRDSADPTAWIRPVEDLHSQYGDKARIVLAHGSVQGFGALPDDDETDSGSLIEDMKAAR